MHVAEGGLGEQAVPGHGEEHAGAAQHHDQQHGRDAGHACGGDEALGPAHAVLLEGGGDGGVDVQLVELDHAGEHGHHGDVEHGADQQGDDDADGDVPLGVLGLLGVGRYRIEADVGEEDDGCARHGADGGTAAVHHARHPVTEEADAGPAEGGEGMPVGGVDEEGAHGDDEEDGGHLDGHHDPVEGGAFLNAFHQDGGDDGHDDERGQVHDGARGGEVAGGGVVLPGRFAHQLGHVDADLADGALEVGGPARGHGRAGHAVFEDEVPADDPGEQFTERGVGIGVGRSCYRHHGSKFRIAERRKDAGDARDDVGHHQRGACYVVGGRAGRHEDARANDGANAQGRELHRAEDAAEAVFALGLFQEQGQGLAGEELGFSARCVRHEQNSMRSGRGDPEGDSRKNGTRGLPAMLAEGCWL